MEDENEWPYLVWENSHEDYNPKPTSNNRDYPNDERPKSDEEKIDDMVNPINVTLSQRMILKNTLLSFLKAKDCVRLTAEGGYDEYVFTFTRENEYVTTTDEFLYYPIFAELRRVFKDCYSSHNHDNLVRNPRFQSLIESTGMEFIKCSGGYVTKYSMAKDEFTLKDELDVGVYFKVGSEKRLYKLDLDRMELSEKYFKY